MERLKRQVNPTDILERYIAVVESVTESPLTKGNKVTLLIDGPSTYAAMFEAIRNAQDHINLETFILEDDEIGRKFTDLLLRKQKEGVQVNIIYDSRGSIKTPESFFQRLRDRGIQAGMKIYERRNVLLHAKTAVIDGVWSTVGSTNLDYWSLLSDDEVNAVVLSRDFAVEMEHMFAGDLAQSDQIQWDQWKERPLWQKIKESFAHLFTRWL